MERIWFMQECYYNEWIILFRLEVESMIYYEDYRLKIVETDGKYTVYDEKIGGRAYYVNKSKEWIDEYIQRVQSKRKRKSKLKINA